MENLLEGIGEEVEDVDEEVFHLFATAAAEQNLGMIDAKAEILEVTVAGKDFVIKQSPGMLNSSREEGTTGAVAWQTGTRLANWMDRHDNALAEASLLHSQTSALELGAGISGVLAITLGRRVRHYVATDQGYTARLLTENINANKLKTKSRRSLGSDDMHVQVGRLDWETDSICGLLRALDLETGVDLILSCDCVYNYALIEPFLAVCEDACKLRRSRQEETFRDERSTICVIAQQLRQPDVFEQWLTSFLRTFRIWRVKDDLLNDDLRIGSGFSVHLAILR